VARAKANGIEIEYETAGDKGDPAVLLVMGLGAQLTIWPDAFFHGLAKRGFFVIRYDNRDTGLSTDFGSWGVPNIADAFQKVMTGKKVDAPQDLQKIVAVTAPGKGVPIKVWREKGEKTLEIKVGETPEDTAQLEPSAKSKTLLGLETRAITPEIARQLNLRTTEGVVVARVEEEGPAAEAGLQRGDVIREINRQRIRSAQDYERATQGLKPGDRVTVLLQRGQQSLYVAFTVARG